MSAEAVIASMLHIASEDLAGARVLAVAENRNAVYLCEQAAEKIIRAVLTSEGKQSGRDHRLDRMVDDIPPENPLKPSLRAIEDLGAYATTFRYPKPSGRVTEPPDDEELATYMAAVERTLNEVSAHFGVDLKQPGTRAKSAAPIR